eukprot:scaffold1415_cov152-Skeletonema_menzelii.AAC.3
MPLKILCRAENLELKYGKVDELSSGSAQRAENMDELECRAMSFYLGCPSFFEVRVIGNLRGLSPVIRDLLWAMS